MKFKYQIISIEEVDLEDRTFLFSYPKRDEILIESIKSIGLIQPPVVFKDDSLFKIICGEGRILACKKLKILSLPVFIVSDTNPKELLLLSLESNLFRPLNIIEKAEFIDRALNFFSVEEVIKLLPKLGINPSFHWVEFLQNIKKLPPEFKELLKENKLNPQLIKNLIALSNKEQKEYLKIFQKLNLSFSEQKDVLEKLLDYKKRNDLPSLLPEELKIVLEEKDFNKRRGKFFEILNKLYFPNYFSKLERIKPLIEKFKNNQINLIFIPYFEKKEIEIRFKVFSSSDFLEKIKFIEKNEENIKKILQEI